MPIRLTTEQLQEIVADALKEAMAESSRISEEGSECLHS